MMYDNSQSRITDVLARRTIEAVLRRARELIIIDDRGLGVFLESDSQRMIQLKSLGNCIGAVPKGLPGPNGEINGRLADKTIDYAYRQGRELHFVTTCGNDISLVVDEENNIVFHKSEMRIIMSSFEFGCML